MLPPPVPAAPVREKSPDQYEKLKLNFLAKQKEALEQELKLLEAQVAGGEQQQNTGIFYSLFGDQYYDSKLPCYLELGLNA